MSYSHDEILEAKAELKQKWCEANGYNWFDIMVDGDGSEYVCSEDGRKNYLPEFTEVDALNLLDIKEKDSIDLQEAEQKEKDDNYNN